jgi:uncharacterized protein (TIGR02246 family)
MRLASRLAGAIALGALGLIAVVVHAQQTPGTTKTSGTAPAAARPAPEDPREKPVRDLLREFNRAYNAADAKALAGLFVDEALVVDPAGSETRGKPTIGEMYAASHREAPGLKLDSDVEQVRFLTPDLARVEGRSRVSAASGPANEFTRFTALAVRGEGTWRLAELREHAAPLQEVPPSERLRELQWMLGEWVDEGDGNRVVVNVRWADNQSYMVRTYHVEYRGEKAHSGTMFIGWDPQTQQIKSWVFDSEGGHGEGYWTRTTENQWVVKASGALRDGRPTSATHVHTIINKDAVKTDSTARIIGGEIAPDILDVVMVRKPPQPTTAAPGSQSGAAPGSAR